ncbi:MAG: shikimate dehydrogenase [Bacteroidota bacterium]
MANIENETYRYGLVGKDISYSFSKGYFTKKFADLGLEHYSYENFDLRHIGEFPKLLNQGNDLKGLNVTIPYKEEVIPFLSGLEGAARHIGAVNTIQFQDRKEVVGHNTDAYGFRNSLEPFLKKHHQAALILGTGGASKAVAYVFNNLGIAYRFVSRNPGKGQLGYPEIDGAILEKSTIVVNCTPLGTFPKVDQKPPIPYSLLTPRHLLYDLIYNPSKTAFLLGGEAQGTAITNGLRMLELQAEKAWEIWNQ